MKDPTQAWAVAAGSGCALLAIALGSTRVLLLLAMFWMLGATTIAFSLGGAVRSLLDSPDMYPRSMKAIARAADDADRPKATRRTAVALYFYMVSMLFCAGAFCTLVLVSFLFFRS